MEKEVTEKRYKPFIDKFKKLKGMNLKEEIKKRDYINNEESKINVVQQGMIYKTQTFLTIIILALQIVLFLYPYFTDNEMTLSFYPLIFRAALLMLFPLVMIGNDIASIKTNCSNKKIEAFQAVSTGLQFAIIIVQLPLLLSGDTETMALLSGNIVIPVLLLISMILNLVKRNKITKQ